jgi:molybdopterin converting factor small subunit
MEVQVRLFGAFRNLGQSEVTVSLPASSVTATEMKTILAQHFGATHREGSFNASALVSKSALANDSAVLGDQDIVAAGSKLALLPPVSGG